MSLRLFKNKKRLIKFAVFIVFVVIISGIAAKLNAPAKGVVNQHPKAQSKPRLVAAQSAPSTQQTAYYELNLPAGFAVVPSAAPPNGILAVQSLTKQLAIGKLVIAIAVKPLPDGGAQADSAYQLRIVHPERYTFTTKTIKGDTVSIANDSQSAGVVAFWPHQGKLATISLTMGFEGPPGDGNADELEQLQTILSAWQWR